MNKYINKKLQKLVDATRHQNQKKLHKRVDKGLKNTFNQSIHRINDAKHIKHNPNLIIPKHQHHKKSSNNNSDTAFDLAFIPTKKNKNKNKSNANSNSSNNDGGPMHMKVQHKHTQQVIHHDKVPNQTSSENKNLLHKAIAFNIIDNVNHSLNSFVAKNNASPKVAKHKDRNIKPSFIPKKHVKGIDKSKGVKLYLKNSWEHNPYNPKNNDNHKDSNGPSISE